MSIAADHEQNTLIFRESNPTQGTGTPLRVCFDKDGFMATNSSVFVPLFNTCISRTTVRLTTQRTFTATGLADVTGLSFSLSANRAYMFQFQVVLQTTAVNTGHLLSINGPANNYIVWNAEIPTAVAAAILSCRQAVNAGSKTTGLTPAATDFSAIIRGLISTTASGTLIVRLASETAGTSVSAEAGSHGVLYEIG